jgi:hypothetical protein
LDQNEPVAVLLFELRLHPSPCLQGGLFGELHATIV